MKATTQPLQRKLLPAAITLATCTYGSALLAQENTALEEVVVTAQKREQALQDVPVSVTAFTSESIERSGIEEFEDYASRTPNVGFTQQGNRAFTKVAIRGVTNIGGKANAVGIYLDEFNIAPNILVNGYSRTADTELFDVERIEVLRGPQGTYFGRNTMGGAINITSQKPDTSAAFGSVKLQGDEHGGYLARTSYNQPLGDSAALRGAVFYREQGGWMDNIGPSDATNDGDSSGARIALYAKPTERLDMDLALSRVEHNQSMPSLVASGQLGSILQQLNAINDQFPLLLASMGYPGPVAPIDTAALPEWPLPTTDAPFVSAGNYDTLATDLPHESSSETDTATARLVYAINDHLTLTSVSGITRNDFSAFGDGDMSVHPAFTVGRDSDMRAWSQEFRLSSSGNGSIDWLLGAIIAEDEISETDISTHLASDPFLDAWGTLLFGLSAQGGLIDFTDPAIQAMLATPGAVPGLFGPLSVGNFEDVDRANETRSRAVFADTTYYVNEDWELSLGLRYTDDRVDFSELTRPTVTLPVGEDQVSTDFTDLSSRVTLNYRLGDSSRLYFTAAKGFKVGGVNSSVTAQIDEVDQVFDKETGWSYELGNKSQWLDNRLQLNLSLFQFDWSNLQVRGQDPLSQRQFVQNASDAQNRGLEIELTALLTDNIQLSTSYGRLSAEFDGFTNAVTTNGDVIDATGNRIPYSPENTFSAALDIDIPLNAGFDGYLHLDYSHIDDQYFDVENSEARMIPAYQLWNARAGIGNDSWKLALFANNLLNEEYLLGLQGLETHYSGLQRSVGTPRTLGASLTIDF
ncbi:TonB-dependent receptor [Microbulbifer marinus]|uniref:Outer membrane receptor proteins, mostly Fe transport n=1 Tax=Microbulbifer marinus TaxID=658218 RepID=A0A1H4A1A2_9GAMM|nr:TonB-dependent receptor [Microbulbifer marinus]SEA29819.1 Outer membrane receptor proteins, mostly Fe transport [Microbulbifer marinus]